MTISKLQRVLVVEDEYFLADDLKRTLHEEGMIVVGPVGTERDALAILAETPVDCAVLDINLHGRTVYALARTLRTREIPFLFLTGYDTAAPDEAFDDIELLEKPFSPEAVMRGIRRLTTTGD